MATKIMDCDLVVIGAGGAGLVAAVKAADVSGKKVIVLEKAKKPGGATIFAHGMPINDSTWQKEAGEAVKNPQDISGRFFDWLVTKGGAEKCFRMAKPGEKMVLMTSVIMPTRIDKYKNHPDPSIGPGWMGTYIVDKMMECCEKKGIPVLTETGARKFTTNANGKISGVLADTKDGPLLVNCKACYIGAGGFGANYEKCKKVWPREFNNKTMHCMCPPTDTGDCIDMATAIGAAIDLEKNVWLSIAGPSHHPYSYTINAMLGAPEMVAINLNGERFLSGVKPTNAHKNAPEDGKIPLPTTNPATLILGEQPKAVMYAVADRDILEMQIEKLISNPSEEVDIPIVKKVREDIAYEVALDEAGAHGNHAKKADTLEELALKMDIDPKAFVATIEKYNKFCDNGLDPVFNKAPDTLKPIRKPPFYAFFGHRWSHTTHGGIVINDNTEVLDADGNVIPGLFAGGDAASAGGGLKPCLWQAITDGYTGGIVAGNYLTP